MTRKDFRAIAEAIAKIEDLETRVIIAEAMARTCAQANPRFNMSKFYEACGVV
jgi:hypothetical protein